MVPLHRVFTLCPMETPERAEEGPANLIMSPRLGRSKKKRNVEGFYTLLILQEQQQNLPDRDFMLMIFLKGREMN